MIIKIVTKRITISYNQEKNKRRTLKIKIKTTIRRIANSCSQEGTSLKSLNLKRFSPRPILVTS